MPNPMHPKVEMVPIGDLKVDPFNPKKHPKEQISRLALVISTYGWLVPIVIDDRNNIVAGHGRLLVAQQLDLTEVPCIRKKFVSEADKRAFALAENRIPELSTYDKTFLNDALSFVYEAEIDLEITGWSVADISFETVEVPDNDTPSETIALPPKEQRPVSQGGDIWQVGDHRLMCGDARLRANWEDLLSGQTARIVFSDLPYNVPIHGHVSGNGQHKHREFVMGTGEMSEGEFIAFKRAIFRNLVHFSTNGSIHYHCMDWRHMREMLEATDGLYAEFKQLIVWNKTNAGQGAFYRSKHELVFVFKNGRGRHINNFKLGEAGRYRTNVVDYAGANTFRKSREEDLSAHSTVKPTAMVMDFLLDCSNKGDLVIDPCIGSGTTLIAAHRTKRRGAGMELDPLYCDVALARLSKAVGVSPTLAGDGRTFDAIKASRLGAINLEEGNDK